MRWDELSRQNEEGNVAKKLLQWIAIEQYRGHLITSKEVSAWAKSEGSETHLSTALSLLFERFMLINQDPLFGNFSIFPSLFEFLAHQR